MTSYENAGVDDDRVQHSALEERVILELLRRCLDTLLTVDVEGDYEHAALVFGLGSEGVELRGVGGVADACDDLDGRGRGEELFDVSEAERAGRACVEVRAMRSWVSERECQRARRRASVGPACAPETK